MRWIEKKERDVKDEDSLDATNKNYDSILKNLDKYKVGVIINSLRRLA